MIDLNSLVRKMEISSLFQCVQVINMTCKVNRANGLVRSLLKMEKILKSYAGNLSKLLARLYQMLLRERGGMNRAKQEWEENLGEYISWEEWINMGVVGRKMFRNTVTR